MPYKDPEKEKECQRKRQKKYYQNHKELVDERHRNYTKRQIELFEEWFGDRACIVCGETELICLDFHHLNPEEKEMGISEMMRRGYSFERMKQEAEKCVVVCSNCHRKITWKGMDITKYLT